MRNSFATAASSAVGLVVTVAVFAWVFGLVSAAVQLGGEPAHRQPLPPASEAVFVVNR